MLCDLCHKNPATVHLTEILDNEMSELHLCDECAKKKSMQMEQQFGLSDLLAGLVDYGKQFASVEKEAPSMQCSHCGLTYEDFRKIGRLGCGECYSAFSKQLGPLLKRIHGAGVHTGKSPAYQAGPQGSKEEEIKVINVADLKEQLRQAILHEEFEEAARLRDVIKEAETKNNEIDSNNKESNKRKKRSS